jgi:hypothetical protein
MRNREAGSKNNKCVRRHYNGVMQSVLLPIHGSGTRGAEASCAGRRCRQITTLIAERESAGASQLGLRRRKPVVRARNQPWYADGAQLTSKGRA